MWNLSLLEYEYRKLNFHFVLGSCNYDGIYPDFFQYIVGLGPMSESPEVLDETCMFPQITLNWNHQGWMPKICIFNKHLRKSSLMVDIENYC
jgi:hypothetical protein